MKEGGHYEDVAVRLDDDGLRCEAIGQEVVQSPVSRSNLMFKFAPAFE